MVDHVKTLLLNPSGVPGYLQVNDEPSDSVMALFGVGGPGTAADVVDMILPLALAPDLAPFRSAFDQRITPRERGSVYRHTYDVSMDGLYERVLGRSGWWVVSRLFSHEDPAVRSVLSDLRDAARGMDSTYALGAVLIACAYRRFILQGGGL